MPHRTAHPSTPCHIFLRVPDNHLTKHIAEFIEYASRHVYMGLTLENVLAQKRMFDMIVSQEMISYNNYFGGRLHNLLMSNDVDITRPTFQDTVFYPQ